MAVTAGRLWAICGHGSVIPLGTIESPVVQALSWLTMASKFGADRTRVERPNRLSPYRE